MLGNQQVHISFAGDMREFDGDFLRKNTWDALKKALLACSVSWLAGIVFIFVPYVNVSVPFVFLPLGLLMAGLVYFATLQSVKRLDGKVRCAKCESLFEIHEKDRAQPLYGQCPNCRAGYEILLPEKTSRTDRR